MENCRIKGSGPLQFLVVPFWVYILGCGDGSYYVGHTDNLQERMHQHGAGEFAGYTKSRRPVTLLFSQEFATRDDAFAAERQVKGWNRKKKEALIRGDWDELRRLSRARKRKDAHPSTGSG